MGETGEGTEKPKDGNPLRKVHHAMGFVRYLQRETKERRIVRVFFSSPFRGLEEEREELTKKYWPRLSSMCTKAGYEFVPVDLRWGITSEKASSAGTVEVCLREVNRSDMFVGFFGQRYGWNGVDDELLQRSFDVAAKTKPWLNQYRDRSVTEIEFLHGHLNNPGDKPACFFFREKEYDDRKLKEHMSEGNEDEAGKYDSNSDGPKAAQFLGDLKERVKATKDECFAFTEGYPDPETGARLMFEAIQKYLEQTILAEPVGEMSDAEKERVLHNAYYVSRLGVGARREYIGGDQYLKEIDRHVLSHVEGHAHKPLLVLGDPGYGKTTLLANWLHRHQQLYPDDVIAYHFVGCTPKSIREKNVLVRLVEELTIGFEQKQTPNKEDKAQGEKPPPTNDGEETHEPKENHAHSGLRSLKAYDLFQKLETIMKQISESGKRAILIVDALNKMDPTHITRKQLSWLPTEFPEGVSMLVSSLTEDTDKTNELINERKWDTLVVEPLKVDDRKRMITEMLSLRGKELTEPQVDRVISKEQSSNALFLKIFIQELCNFGDFWRLEEHLNFLLGATSTKELFMKILERLETDFNPQDTTEENMIAQIMGCILVSRYGLSDHIIKDTVKIADHVWSTVFFAMEDFFIDRGGMYGFAYDELAAAVQDRYLEQDNSSKMYTKMLADCHQNKLNDLGRRYTSKNRAFDRIADELPWLLQKLEARDQLKSCLTHLCIFNALLETHDSIIDLYGYWNSTEASGDEISSLYMKSIDEQVALLYTENLEEYKEPLSPAKELLNCLYNISEIICDCGYQKQSIPILKRALRYQQYAYTMEEVYEKLDVADTYMELLNKLACVYCDLEMFSESEKLHKQNLEIKEKLQEKWKTYGYQIGITLNGLGLLCKAEGKNEEAMDYIKRCLELHRARSGDNHRLIGASLNNIGTILIKEKKFEEAIEYFNQTLEMYAICYFGRFHTEIAGTLNNIAVCYRNLKQLDKAEPIYEKTYTMAVNAFGEKHPEVALKLMNWGTFQLHKKNYEKALEMFLKSYAIYHECYGDEHLQTLLIMENVAMAYAMLNRHEEAEPFFNKAGEALYRQGRLDISLKGLNRRMLAYYLEKETYQSAIGLLQRILNSQVEKPMYYLAFDDIINDLPENERPEVRHEQTPEYAVTTRYPANREILEYMEDWYEKVDRVITLLKLGKYECKAYERIYKKFSEESHRKEGMQVLNAAMELFPEEPSIYLSLGKAHAASDENERAAELLNKGLALDPKNVDMLVCLGEVLIKKGENGPAEVHLRKALELSSDDNEKVNQIEEILKKLEQK